MAGLLFFIAILITVLMMLVPDIPRSIRADLAIASAIYFSGGVIGYYLGDILSELRKK